MSDKYDKKTVWGRLTRVARRYRAFESAGRFFSQFVRLAAPGVVVLLTALFVSKLLWPPLFYAIYAGPAWLVAVGIYVAFHPEMWLVKRSRASAVVDLGSGSHGLYMALQEAEGHDWEADLPDREVRVKTHFPVRSTAWALLLLVAFVGLLFMPDLSPSGEASARARTPVKRMSRVVEELEVNELADEEYLEDTKKLLEKLEEKEASSLQSEDWQALDEAGRELEKQAMDSYRRLQEEAEAASSLGDKLGRGKKLTAEEAKQVAKLLSKHDLQKLAKLSKVGKSLSASQLKKMLSRCKAGKGAFSAEKAKALAKLMKECKKQAGKKAGKCKGCLGGMGFSEQALASYFGKGPGRGGVNRGPGTAPIQHSQRTDPEMGQFKAKTFDASKGDPEASMGHVTVAPDEEAGGDGETAGRGPVRQFGPGNERITWRSRLRPRHNDVLKNYFESENGEKD